MTKEIESGAFLTQETLQFGGVLQLSLVGELDLAAAPALERRLHELRVQQRAVRIDLSRLEFIDSSGLRVLLAAWNHRREAGWSFEIGSELPPQAAQLLRLTGTDHIVGGREPNPALSSPDR